MELSADIQREIQQQFKNSYAQLLADITHIYEQGAMRDALTGLYNKQALSVTVPLITLVSLVSFSQTSMV